MTGPTAKKVLSGRERARIQAKTDATNAWVAQFLKSELPGSDLTTAEVKGVIRAIHAAGSLPFTAAEYGDLKARFIDRLRTDLSAFSAKDFGVASTDTLADLLIRMIELTDYSTFSAAELRKLNAGVYSRMPGLRSRFAGKLMELIVLNHVALQEDFLTMAHDRLETLKDVAAGKLSKHPGLLTADGKPFTAKGTFGDVRHATDLWTIEPSGKKQFIDAAYVSEFTPADGGPKRLAILVEIEIKIKGKQEQFDAQSGGVLARWNTVDAVTMTLDGVKDETYELGQLIFDPTEMNRAAVTTTSRSTETYSWRTTTAGDYQENYLRVGLTINVDELYKMSNLLFTL